MTIKGNPPDLFTIFLQPLFSQLSTIHSETLSNRMTSHIPRRTSDKAGGWR